MARITVEDCLEHVDNRFQLVLVATKRARQIEQGKQPLLELENDKPTVIALREIAAGLVNPSILKEVEPEPEPEAEMEEAMMAEMEAEPEAGEAQQASAESDAESTPGSESTEPGAASNDEEGGEEAGEEPT